MAYAAAFGLLLPGTPQILFPLPAAGVILVLRILFVRSEDAPKRSPASEARRVAVATRFLRICAFSPFASAASCLKLACGKL